MDFRELFVNSLSYPFTDLKKFLILFVLSILSILLVPILIIYGYEWRIVEHSLKNDKNLPNFHNLSQLIENGFKLAVVSIIYGIPTIITFLLFKQFTMNSIDNFYTLSSGFTSPMIFIISIIIGFFVSFVFVIGLPNMVYENRFMAAFDFKRIFQLIKTIELKKYIAYIIVYSIIVNLISFCALIVYHTNGSSYFVWLIVIYILSIYTRIFTSRFKGLIYPVRNKIESK